MFRKSSLWIVIYGVIMNCCCFLQVLVNLLLWNLGSLVGKLAKYPCFKRE